MAPARSLPPVATTRTGADLCTTGSTKTQTESVQGFKARSADAISMSLLVPLLEFNQNTVTTLAHTVLRTKNLHF
jgi:hypothetical protein